MQLKNILEMIEAVDPSNAEALKILDYYVSNYVDPNALKYDLEMGYEPKRYTRSRDALKTIRPEGWIVYDLMQDEQLNWFCQLIKRDHKSAPTKVDHILPTEELAELHAILQAIEWDRTHD
jgi:hypothetical protein